LEDHVRNLYSLADASPSEPPGIVTLLHRLGGELGIHRGEEFERGDARLCVWPDGTYLIEVHAGLSLDVAASAIARAICDWYSLHVERSFALDPDEFAAAIMLPEPSIRLAMRDRRASAESVAEAFAVPLSVAKARLAKCALLPTRSGVYARS
jgi:hypothetical protein